MSFINPELLQIASWAVRGEKVAFMPPESAQMAMDPAAMGGAAPMPPGPPMPGSMPVGAPVSPDAIDPIAEATGAAPPGGGGQDIRAIIREEIQAAMGGGAVPGAAGAPAGGGGKGGKKQLETDVYQIKAMLVKLFNVMGVDIPPEAVMGPPEAAPAAGAPAAGAPAGGQAQPPASAIQPIEPIQPALQQPAMPQPANAEGTGGQVKKSDEEIRVGKSYGQNGNHIGTRAAAISAILRSGRR